MGLVSKKCVDFVKRFEGYEPLVKNDMVGVPTLGYGMTGQEIKGLRYVTEGQASKMLEDLLNSKYALPIKNSLVAKGVMLNQNQFDAITSMAYNIGVDGLLNSTLYKNICNGNRDRNLITSNFRMWSKAGGNTVNGLLRRRTEEAQMFFTPTDSRFPRNGTITGNGVNVRVDAGTGFKIVTQLNKGNIVRVTKTIGANWYAILLNGTTRYISSKYVKLD